MNPGPKREPAETLSLQLAALASELTALVDEMEAGWRERGIVSKESARRLHSVRERADRLLGEPVADKLNGWTGKIPIQMRDQEP